MICSECGIEFHGKDEVCPNCVKSKWTNLGEIDPNRVDPLHKPVRNSSGQRDMIIGGLVCVVGILITAITYSSAEGGGTYVVAWGAIVFGAIQFFRGLYKYYQ